MLRFGGPVPECATVEQWLHTVKRLGYNAVYCPVTFDTPEALKDEYLAAARENDLVIAEVGAWSNPLAADPAERAQAIEKNIQALALADRMGARCCVNVSGAKQASWCGPAKENYDPSTFEEIVARIRHFIDTVQPKHTFYTIEAMQWATPDSVDDYLRLLEAVDRPQFAVHLDPVNLITSPRLYYENAALLRDAFARLGSRLRSCHAKDILLREDFLVHLCETRIGTGMLDYKTYLLELSRHPEVPLMLEHLPDMAQYALAAEKVRAVAKEIGIAMPQPAES